VLGLELGRSRLVQCCSIWYLRGTTFQRSTPTFFYLSARLDTPPYHLDSGPQTRGLSDIGIAGNAIPAYVHAKRFSGPALDVAVHDTCARPRARPDWCTLSLSLLCVADHKSPKSRWLLGFRGINAPLALLQSVAKHKLLRGKAT
jgi:hypothetical protein